MRNVLLVINSVLITTTIVLEFPVRSNNTIYWGAEGLGEECVKITLIVSCLEWFTCLFLFIMVEFDEGLYGPDQKMALIFLVTKVFQKSTMFK